MTEHGDGDTAKVVVNDEEQYALWPSSRACPPGWTETGFSGSRTECLAHVDQVWTDMRPLSVRRLHGD